MYNAGRQELSYRAMIVENTGIQALGLASFFLFFFWGSWWWWWAGRQVRKAFGLLTDVEILFLPNW